MSSMTAGYLPSAEDFWSKPPLYQSQSAARPSQASNGQSNTDNSWFTSGLPTPPGKIMNGVSVGSSLPTLPTNHSYPIRHPSTEASFPNRPSYSSQIDVQYPQHPTINGHSAVRHEKTASSLIASHLQIPDSINKSKGSLAEFASEITCLFWFETSSTLEYAENLPEEVSVDRGLVADATPSMAFRKWVTTILSTTQVGKNVILLALMFIYRLKKFNPSVSGKRGSEFRLLTIALMLGNKFLDDNTYTNKTWAEVSGISVSEIHIMEVEFLSNMRYELYVSESEWKGWKATLGRLGSFYEKALNFAPVPAPGTPLSQSFGHKLPSPPSTHHSHHSPLSNYNALPNLIATAPHLPPSPLRQQRNSGVDVLNGRKRSVDLGSEQPAAKRLHLPPNHNSATGHLTPVSYTSHDSGVLPAPPMEYGTLDQTGHAELPRLPMPRLAVPATMPNSNQLAPLNLPGSRAMSNVYPAVTSAGWSQPVTPVSAVPANLYQSVIPNLGEMSRPHSNAPSSRTSPVGYGTTTPILPGLSPSYFLTNRSSPYRPVRNVNTLVIPPPSAALQNSVRNINHDQIHYQPLSKTNTERRTGPIPYFQPEGWLASGTSTPTQQKWSNRF